MSSDSIFDGKDLSKLLALLEGNQAADGIAHANHIWKEIMEEQNSSLDSLKDVYDDSTVQNVKRTHERSKNMLHALQILARSLEEKTVTFEHRMARAGLKSGIGILPFEIIPEILAGTTPTLKEALELSQVNSQFRRAMLSSPLIWASYDLHTRMGSEQIASLANRSGTRSLTASIFSKRGIEDWNKRVDLIFSLSMRLKKLVIEDLDNSSASLIQINHSKVHMPILEDLSIGYRGYFQFGKLYASWSFENIKRLQVTDFVPNLVFGKHLSFCHLKFTLSFPVGCLVRFLAGLTSLKTLKIELVDIEEDMDMDDDGDASLENSAITCYQLHVIGLTWISFAERVLDAIHPPNLVEMTLSIVYPSRVDFETDYSASSRRKDLLAPVRQISTLKILNLQFQGPDSKYELVFSTILLRMPHGLESIRLEAPGHILDMYWMDYMGDYEAEAPRIRTLRFRNCDGMKCSFLEKVRKDLFDDGVQIERFEVIGCPLVGEEELRASFPTMEVVWVA
ncbi:hypothetical protein DFH11DRAFT_1237383 [Phellopilus nigrolimitatus]|nr:hypothetical protein DFH11DRAFT_1237383 [Phellopilus nigrolimitatus]